MKDEIKVKIKTKLEKKFRNTWLKDVKQIGKEVTKCLQEAEKVGFLIQSMTINVDEPYFETDGIWLFEHIKNKRGDKK